MGPSAGGSLSKTTTRGPFGWHASDLAQWPTFLFPDSRGTLARCDQYEVSKQPQFSKVKVSPDLNPYSFKGAGGSTPSVLFYRAQICAHFRFLLFSVFSWLGSVRGRCAHASSTRHRRAHPAARRSVFFVAPCTLRAPRAHASRERAAHALRCTARFLRLPWCAPLSQTRPAKVDAFTVLKV